jgi:D-cysteine desulfhydrase
MSFSPDEFVVNDAFLGGGYGVLGPEERSAIQILAQTEGLLLDPVYTARAMAGLLGLMEDGAFDSGDNVCFWHTGGTPGIFAYGNALLQDEQDASQD